MVDLHCHILPGLDDGAKTIEESMAMAESAIAEGVTRIVATPHSSRHYFFDFALVRRLRDELQSRIGNKLELATGCDFHLDPENLNSLRKDSSIYCINQHDYLLVEFNEISIPPAMDQTLHEIQLAGMHPIVTHPERNRILRAHPERLKKWVSTCCGQVTGG
jgi:protein-tyrosine phosphatase